MPSRLARVLRTTSKVNILVRSERQRVCARCLTTNAADISRFNGLTKPSRHGQPTFGSHPHLVKRNEITPGIPRSEYETRRKRLMESLPEGSMVVAVGGPVKYLSGEIFYKFRQASNFWYLTGFQEPESAVILEKTSSSRNYKMTLFCRGKDAAREQWDGARTTFDSATSHFGADDARHIADFPSHLKSLTNMYSNVYLDLPSSSRRSSSRSKTLLKFLNAASNKNDAEAVMESVSSSKRKELAPEVAKLRAVKSEAEVNVMRRAADVSGNAHAKTMRFTEPGMSESTLAAHFEYICARDGAQRLAYVPVVASGPNALIIHYTQNDQLVLDGEMVLTDAGCEFDGYASDITRTYPSSGTFTPAQRDLYSAVLIAQKACVALCSENASTSSMGGMSLNDLHRRSSEILREELNQIGFNLDRNDVERVLYPHFLSHPIGIDLHESAYFDRSAPLKAGMVITIEPGIYVPPNISFPKHFHNIGIRIEDEVLIGKDHPVVLSVSAPKEIADIEGACQGSLGLQPF